MMKITTEQVAEVFEQHLGLPHAVALAEARAYFPLGGVMVATPGGFQFRAIEAQA